MISWDGRPRTLVVGDRGVGARSVEPAGDGWAATIRLRSGVDLTVEAAAPSVETVGAALWTRPADRGVGVAVLANRDDNPGSLVTIPLCGCGDRGCGHVGRQLVVTVTADGLAELIDQLDSLDISGSLRDDATLWFPPVSLPRP